MRAFFTGFLLLILTAVWGQRTCGTMDVLAEQIQQNPALLQQMQAIEQHNDHYHQHLHEQVGFRNVITIPVVFHVIHNGDALGTNENISDARILAQLQQLNDDFRKMNTDAASVPAIFQGLHADTEIQFCLAQRKPDGTATNGINRVQYSQATWTSSQVNSTIKPATVWNRNQYLNVWTVVFGGSSSNLLGYAQFPGGSASTDGVVVSHATVGSLTLPNPASNSFGRGRTLTHEVGHWLNLRHIWGDATCGNDLVADTPVHNASNSGCPTYPHYSTCTGTPIEMTMNYMDYTNDVCMYMFTAGQKTRMQAVLASGGARFSLLSSLGCVPPGATCAAPAAAQLSATNITATSVQLQCSVSGVNAYDWRYRQQGTATWTDLPSTTTGITTVTGLSASTSYEFQAQVQCGSVWSDWSVSQTFATAAGGAACTTPAASQISVSEITSSSARIEVSVTGAGSYLWRYRLSGASTWTNLPATTVNFTYIFGLNARSNYEVQVALVCNSITTAWSAGVSFNTGTSGAAVCNAPDVSQLSANNITTTSATLQCSSPGVSSFTWRYRATGANTWTDAGSTPQGTIALSGLSPNTTYEFQVLLQCGNGQSSVWSGSQTFTTASAATCDAPTAAQLSATNISTTSAQLNCSVSGQLSYSWRYRLAGTTTWATLPGTTVNFAIVNGLSASSNYEFQVLIQCSNGLSSDWSGTQTFSTAAEVCNAPAAAQVSVSNITSASARLQCAVTGVTAYLWRYRAVGSSTWIDLGSTVAAFYDLNNLSASTSYEYAVAVQCGAASSAWSPTQNFATLSAVVCTAPTSRALSVSSITATGAVLVCSLPADQYQWRYRPTGASNWITAGQSSINSWTLSGLLPQTSYEFQVSVACGSTWSDWSPSRAFSTLGGARHLTGLHMEVWPVPAREQLFVRYLTPEDAVVILTITDMAGKVVLSENMGRQTAGEYLHEMRLEQLPAGTYSIQIQTGKNICREKFIRFAE